MLAFVWSPRFNYWARKYLSVKYLFVTYQRELISINLSSAQGYKSGVPSEKETLCELVCEKILLTITFVNYFSQPIHVSINIYVIFNSCYHLDEVSHF